MAGISSLGVGSGLELGALVESLIEAERAPAKARLDTKQSRAETKLSALGALKSSVSTLATAVEALEDFETALKAESSDTDVLAVAVGGQPDAGTYQVRVLELAAAQSLASETFDDVDASLGEGTLTITVGDSVVDIDLAAGADSLADVRDAINESDAGVQAVIVRDGHAHRLLLTSAESGLEQQITATVDGTVDARLASAAMTETAAARDASFTVNGLPLTASGNTVDDVIPGVTLTLKQRTEVEQTVAVTVQRDDASFRGQLEAVVKAYNALVARMEDLGRSDAEGGRRGALVGDSTLRALEARLRSVFSTAVDAGDGRSFTLPLDIGLHTDENGNAALDTERLDEALAADEAGVEALVSAFAASFGATLDTYADSDGLLDARTEGLDSELERIAEQREALGRRMEQVEARLRAQFTALDALVAQFQSTSQFLTGQLAGLSGLRL